MLNFFFFGGTGVSTQGFEFTKQALYHLSPPSVHFALVIFGDGGSQELFGWLALNCNPPDLSLLSS
jgi:hypothetical protein